MSRLFTTLAAVLVLTCCASTRQSSRIFLDQAALGDGGTELFAYNGTVDLDEVNADNMARVVVGLEKMSKTSREATLRIDSPGGEIAVGLKAMQMVLDLKKRSGLKITCVVDGMAASMAAVWLESPVCDLRLATPASLILFHDGHGGGQGGVQDLHTAAEMLEVYNLAMASIIAPRMGLTVPQYRAKVSHRDWVMSADQALAEHAIDGIVSSGMIAPPAVVAE